MDFYDNARAAEAIRPDIPRSDLDLFFRREAGLDDPRVSDAECEVRSVRVARKLREDAALLSARPSRRMTASDVMNNTYRTNLGEPLPHQHGVKGCEPALGLYHTKDMNGQLTGRDAVLRFIRAGNATVTVVSKATGTRYTYKFQRPKDWEPGPQRPVAPTFCKVLTGADNNSDFEFVGTMWPEDSRWPDGAQVYRHGKNARIQLSAASVKALVWFLRTALAPGHESELAKAEIWHEGRCGRCGRKLTVPTSIASGYGPECEGRM